MNQKEFDAMVIKSADNKLSDLYASSAVSKEDRIERLSSIMKAVVMICAFGAHVDSPEAFRGMVKVERRMWDQCTSVLGIDPAFAV